MNDQQIVEYLRSRGRAEPPVDFTQSVMAAVDAAPDGRSGFSAYLPAFVAVGAAAVVAVLALLLGSGRDVGPAPSPSAAPSATAEAATVDFLRVALMRSVDVLRAAPGVQGRQQVEIDGTIGSATWFDWRPNGDQVVVTRWDVDVTETGWWMEPDGVPPATGQRIYTDIQANVGDEFFFTNEGGDWQVAARDDEHRILAIGPGILDASIVPWDPLMGLDPSFPDASEAEARVEREERSDGGVEWRLDSELVGEPAVQRWTIGPGGELRSWTMEREDRSVDPDGDFMDNATFASLVFTVTEGEPIAPPDIDAIPDPAEFGLPTDLPLGPGREAEIDYHQYVEDALTVLETYHWETESIDWAAARSAALDDLPDDPDAAQAHQRIRDAIATFDVFGTAFVSPRDVPRDGGGGQGPQQLPSADRIGRVGHVSLPSPGEGGPDTLRDYLRAAHAAMSAIEATDAACGWIVDLRDYGGGGWGPPMWALGGLIGPGRAVTFSSPGGEWGLDVGPDGVVTAAGFDGVDTAASPYIDTSFESASDDGFVAARDDEPPYLPSVAGPPVAVLIGNGTVSGGEQAAVAFLGRPNTRTFGSPTGGSPIVAPNLPMLDEAVLRMPIWVPTDREGQRYTTNILPDEAIGDTRSTGPDAVLDAAVEWLEGQPGCS